MELVEIMRNSGSRFSRPVGFLSDSRTGEILHVDAFFGHNGTVRGTS